MLKYASAIRKSDLFVVSGKSEESIVIRATTFECLTNNNVTVNILGQAKYLRLRIMGLSIFR